MTLTSQISPLIEIFLDLSLVPDNTFLGHSIRVACDEGVPVREIVRQLKSQADDNEPMVIRCIGIDLMNKINNLYESGYIK